MYTYDPNDHPRVRCVLLLSPVSSTICVDHRLDLLFASLNSLFSYVVLVAVAFLGSVRCLTPSVVTSS
jgi:hypothetical protein